MASRVFPTVAVVSAVILLGLAAPAPAAPARPGGPGERSYVDARYADSTTVAVQGTVTRAEIDRPGDGSRAAYAVTTHDGTVVPVTLTKELPANGRFSGRLVVRGRLAEALDRAGLLPADGRAIGSGTAAARTAVATAEDLGTPLPVAEATVVPAAAVSATAVPSAHRAYVVRMTDQGSVNGTDAAVGAAVDSMLSYWTTESDGAITSFDRVGAIVDYDSAADIPPAQGCGLNAPFTIWNDARNLFPGVDFNDPGEHLVVLVGEECGGTGPVGVAQLGSSIADGGPSILTYDPQTFASTGVHELGHNFGLDHANLDTCPSPSICEYYDLYSPMALSVGGSTFTPPALGSLYRIELGLAATGEIATVALSSGQTSLTQSHALAPRSSGAGTRGLLVTDPTTGTTYSVDWRNRTGRDTGTFYGSPYVFGAPLPDYDVGVVVERQAGSGATYLMTHTDGDGDLVGSYSAGETFAPSSRLSVAVTSIGATAAVTVTIAAPTPPPAVASSTPAISGTVAVGRTVTAVPGSWTAGTSFAYDWRLDGVSTGKVGPTYVLPSSAAGRSVTVRVTGSKAGFSTVTQQSLGVVVRKGTFATRKPTISGTPKVGRTLTASTGTWAPAPTFSYAWKVSGSTKVLGTARTFKPTSSQRGKKIVVTVTGRKTGWTTAGRTSSATGTVAR